MANTGQLIDALAGDGAPVRPMQTPAQLALRLGGVLLVYAMAVGAVLGLRPDLAEQLQRPFFLAEILLLLAVIFSSVAAAILLVFPDQYQQAGAVRCPVYSAGAFVLLLLVQLCLPPDARMVIPLGTEAHAMECALCIASVAMIPSAWLFFFLRKGASVYPFLSGAYAVLASGGIGCLMLLLAEANDALMHLALWHYIPTLLFAAIGALTGKIFLKW